MSSSTGHQPPLTYGSQNQQQQVYHHQPLVDSRTASSWSQTIIILLLTLLLFHILYPTKIMDLLDAYMELPYLSIFFHALTYPLEVSPTSPLY